MSETFLVALIGFVMFVAATVVIASHKNRRMTTTIQTIDAILELLNAMTTRIEYLTGQVSVLKDNYQILYTEVDTMCRKTIPAMQETIEKLSAKDAP